MKVEATKEQVLAAKKVAESMKADGKLQVKEAPVWVAQSVLASASRTEGEFFNDGRTVVFKELPKELKELNLEGAFLTVKGSGPVINIAVAKAVRDYPWKLDDGRTGTIKKGDTSIRCFAI